MKMKRRRALISSILIFCLVSAHQIGVKAQGAAVGGESRKTIAGLRERIASWLDQPQFIAARWGIQIVKKDGTVVYARDAEKSFMPASNMKLYTAAAAIDAFGPDFRLETSVYATEPISRSGSLSGDLIIYGRGDPNLSARFTTEGDHSDFKPADLIPAIESLADQIKARGIKRIKGDLIGDDSYFSGDLLGPGWEWDDAQFYYGAEISALTVNDNAVTFTVKPASRVGGAPQIEVQPRTAYLSIINQAETSDRGPTRIGVRRPLNSNTVVFFGTIPRTAEKFEVNIAVHDPARFAATLLKEALERRGIRVAGQARRYDAVTRLKQPLMPEKLERVALVTSQPLAEMLKVINKPSQNLHTELMLRQLGVLRGSGASLDDYGMPVSTDARGNDVRRQFLQKAGIDPTGLSLRDGSGLARQDLVTPRSTVGLLIYMLSHPHFEVFRQSLPIAGVDGTLNRRMRETTAAGNVRAKTGTLSFVNALSGYLTTKRGDLLAFSMMGNNYTGPGRDVTAIFDQICILLCEYEGDLNER